MLNGPSPMKGNVSTALFRKPHPGPSSIIHPRVEATLGKIYATQNMNSSPREKGSRVRARTKLIAIAIGKLMAATRNHIVNEFHNDDRSSGCSQAVIQLENPHSAGPTRMSCAPLKLRIRSSARG